MHFTTIVSTKGQVTLPKKIRDKLKITAGSKVDIYPIPDGFVGRLQSLPKIMDFSAICKRWIDKNHCMRSEATRRQLLQKNC